MQQYIALEQIAVTTVSPKKKGSGWNPWNSWLGTACSYRRENPTGFTTIARLCEIFLKDYTNASYPTFTLHHKA